MTDADVERVLSTRPFRDIDPRRFPESLSLLHLVRNDMRILQIRAGDIVVRRGDYGHSAFFSLSGSLRVEVDTAHSGITEAMLGRSAVKRKDLLGAVSQLWRNAKWPEVRRPQPHPGTADTGVRRRRDTEKDIRMFLQDVPAILTNTATVLHRTGQWFGMVAALGRAPHAATIFAETDAELLEIRWQGLREIRDRAPEIREDMDRLYREQSLKAHLHEMPMFAHLSDRELARVADQTEFITYGSFDWYGTYQRLADRSPAERLHAEPLIAEEGHYPNGVILIRSGFARVTQHYGHGQRTLSYLGRGHMYGFEEIASNWRLDHETRPGEAHADVRGELAVVQGRQTGQHYLLGRTPQTVGRTREATIAIDDASLSREHCVFTLREHAGVRTYMVRDCQSTNGTYVNGRRVEGEAVPLHDGDQITLGNVVLKFSHLAPIDEPARAPAVQSKHTGGTPVHQSSSQHRPGRVSLKRTLRAIGYVDILLVPTAAIERYVLPTIPAEMLPPLLSPDTAADTFPLPDDTATGVGADMLEFLVENRFMNGTATMLIDLDRCTRCDDCVRACAVTHDGNPRFLRHGAQVGQYMVANACMHCADPVCMIGCPTGAIHRDAVGGQVVINDVTCIGCSICAESCPYQNIRMTAVRDSGGRFLLEELTRAPILTATKCDLCREQMTGPACQEACPHDALSRVNMQELHTLGDWLNR